MTRRKTTPEEHEQFETAFKEARALKAVAVGNTKKKAVTSIPSGIDGGTAERMRRGTLEPDARLDLHGYTESDAHRVLLLFLRSAQMRGHRLILVVTGKGKAIPPDAPFDMELNGRSRGILKSAVPRWLAEPDFAGLVAERRAAHRRHGGDGALYIYLRKNR
jgi:DNA-nicking Smr family endonuclease